MTTQITHIRSLLNIFEDKDTDVLRNVVGGSELLVYMRQNKIITHAVDLEEVDPNSTFFSRRTRVYVGDNGCACLSEDSDTYTIDYRGIVFYQKDGQLQSEPAGYPISVEQLIKPLRHVYEVKHPDTFDKRRLALRKDLASKYTYKNITDKHAATGMLFSKMIAILLPAFKKSLPNLKNSIKELIDNKNYDSALLLTSRASMINNIIIQLDTNEANPTNNSNLSNMFMEILTASFRAVGGDTKDKRSFQEWCFKAASGSAVELKQIVQGFKNFVHGKLII